MTELGRSVIRRGRLVWFEKRIARLFGSTLGGLFAISLILSAISI
jgi:hypothetical protein